MSDAGGAAEEVRDLVVIGGGIMGLFTAYCASQRFTAVTVLEKGRVGDPATASFGLTRSYRRDYLEPLYARLADEAMTLWSEFEADTGVDVLVRCGCVNIASSAVTPDLDATYARRSADVLGRIGVALDTFEGDAARERFPLLRADLAILDEEAGVVDLGAVTGALRSAFDELGVELVEGVETTSITSDGSLVTVTTSEGTYRARSLVITAGHGTNAVLRTLAGCELEVPITKDRPSEAKYFLPPPERRDAYSASSLPVVAYLDTGIYLHPIVDGVIEAVKIGYYNPPDVARSETSIDSITAFVEQCLPDLLDADVTDVDLVDQCDYDLVADDDFVIGAVPGFRNVFVGVGWRGTGYKFSPFVGRALSELALQEGTVYDLSRFDPGRFSTRR